MKRSLLVVFVLVAFLLILTKYAFTIKSIDVKGDENCLNKENVQASSHILGKNIFLINTSQVGENLKKENSCLDSVFLSRRLPSELIFSVKAKVPVAKIDGTDLLATKGGLIIMQQTTTNIPTVYLPGNIKVQKGAKITDESVLFALDLTSALLKSDFTPSSVRIISPEDIAVYSTNETVALFATRMSAASQVDSLQSILTKAKIDASKIAKIDLRFNKPIIIFK